MPEVYAHRAPSGRVYVGWTSGSSHDRWIKHVAAARAGSAFPFHRAIRKYGPSVFKHEVLERMTTNAGAKRAEQLWIAQLGAFGPAGYNATEGGEGAPGVVVSAETRAKQSALRKGKPSGRAGSEASPETRARMRLAHLGKAHPNRAHACSDETRAKIAASKRGRPLSVEHRAAIKQGHARRKAAA